MNILLVESDETWFKEIRNALTEAFPSHHIIWIASEKAFKESISELAQIKFDVAIFGVKISWMSMLEQVEAQLEEQSDIIPLPLEVANEIAGIAPYRGGIRCRTLLNDIRRDINQPEVPSFFYSELNDKDLEGYLENPFLLVTKPNNTGLISKIISLCNLEPIN